VDDVLNNISPPSFAELRQNREALRHLSPPSFKQIHSEASRRARQRPDTDGTPRRDFYGRLKLPKLHQRHGSAPLPEGARQIEAGLMASEGQIAAGSSEEMGIAPNGPGAANRAGCANLI
jgi:hypothetical protein